VKRAALLLPGRGSYTQRTMRTLPREHPFVLEAEALRKEYALPPLLELDHAERFRSKDHLRPDNVSPLIYVISMLDAAKAAEEHEIVAVAGNSMGWYTALAAAGALDFGDGFRLVQEMSILQMEHADGGQVLYPLIDDQWRKDPKREEAVRAALASSGGEAFPSIDLCGYTVLAGTAKGVEHLLSALPPVEMGPSLYPYALKEHGPYHTPLLAPVAEKAARQLARLAFRAPRATLIDGRGARHAPWTADPDELRRYTLGDQITTPFGFATSVRVALREHAPDHLVLPGPGNTLGGICGQVLVAEKWKGIGGRDDFERIQAGDRPVVVSMRR
jgi:malonyl CoA-acyl carrier protein transacylase